MAAETALRPILANGTAMSAHRPNVIFARICPGAEFHALARKVEDAIVYRDEQDSNDEKVVLESACTMMQAPPEDNEETEKSDGLEPPS